MHTYPHILTNDRFKKISALELRLFFRSFFVSIYLTWELLARRVRSSHEPSPVVLAESARPSVPISCVFLGWNSLQELDLAHYAEVWGESMKGSVGKDSFLFLFLEEVEN